MSKCIPSYNIIIWEFPRHAQSTIAWNSNHKSCWNLAFWLLTRNSQFCFFPLHIPFSINTSLLRSKLISREPSWVNLSRWFKVPQQCSSCNILCLCELISRPQHSAILTTKRNCFAGFIRFLSTLMTITQKGTTSPVAKIINFKTDLYYQRDSLLRSV